MLIVTVACSENGAVEAACKETRYCIVLLLMTMMMMLRAKMIQYNINDVPGGDVD